MKTMNIFRMILVAAALLVGVNSIQAGEREVEFQGNYNYQYDNFVAANTEFSDMAEGSIFRIYVSNINTNGWKLYICGGASVGNNISWANPAFEGWESGVDISWYTWYDNSKGYSFNNEYFEFTCTATTVSVFQTYGLFIDNDGSYTIDRITYTTDAATVEKYSVNLPSGLTGGTVTASPTRQEAGKTVTLTITPNNGYEVGTVSATDGDGNSVTLSGSGNTRTFTMPSSAVTVTATFNAIDYTVTAGTGISVNKTTAHAGDAVTITYNVPAGYAFAGLSVKDANGQSVQVSNNQFTMPASNVTIRLDYQIVVDENTTVTPLWGPSSQAIDWWNNRIELQTANLADAQVGDIIRIKGSMGSENNYFTVQFDDNTQIPNWGYNKGTSQSFSGSGYVDAAITADFLAQIQNNQTRNVTGYNFTVTEIQWLHNAGEAPTFHTLTISIDGTTTTKQVAEGAALADVLTAPTKTGYTFTGWSGLPADGLMPTSDLTVTATFSINSYHLTYTVDGETYGEVETIEYGATVTPRTEPTREGYTFSGWSGLPTTMPANDVTVSGTFSKNKEYLTVTIASSTGYATFCSDKALDFTNNSTVKAFYAEKVGESVVTLKQVTGAVAAGTGLVLQGATSQVEIAESGDEIAGNLLVGVLNNAVTVNASNAYVLVEKNGIAKFADTGSRAATVPVGKAYLRAASANGRELRFSFDDETTAIGAIGAESRQGDAIYNLQGQRINSLGKGLYIIHGKKVIIK